MTSLLSAGRLRRPPPRRRRTPPSPAAPCASPVPPKCCSRSRHPVARKWSSSCCDRSATTCHSLLGPAGGPYTSTCEGHRCSGSTWDGEGLPHRGPPCSSAQSCAQPQRLLSCSVFSPPGLQHPCVHVSACRLQATPQDLPPRKPAWWSEATAASRQPAAWPQPAGDQAIDRIVRLACSAQT